MKGVHKMGLTPGQVEQFKNTGFLCSLPVADEARKDVWRQKFDVLEGKEGREISQVGLHDRHYDQEFIWDVATSPAVLDAIEAIIGPDIMLLASQFFCKYGEGENFVAWHQDVTYWGLEPPFAITAWYAVDDSDHDNGCMVVLPGSHLTGIQEHGKSATEGNLLSINQEVPVTDEEATRAVDLELKAGEMSLHHGMLAHSSQPNRSSRRRCGLVMRYIPPTVKQVVLNSLGNRYRAVLVRGEDREHNFGDIPAPF